MPGEKCNDCSQERKTMVAEGQKVMVAVLGILMTVEGEDEMMMMMMMMMMMVMNMRKKKRGGERRGGRVTG